MDLTVTFLGTAASVPTAARGTTATLIARGGRRWLVDCGEGTQRQFLRSGLGLIDLDMVLVTHLHGDHYLGLPGLLKTYGLRARERPLTLVGPAGLRALLDALWPTIGRLPFALDAQEAGPDEPIWFGEGAALRTFATRHSIASLGYRLVEEDRPGHFDVAVARALGVPEGPEFGRLQRGEPVVTPAGRTVTPAEVLGPPRAGRAVVLTGDTEPCEGTLAAAAGASVLVHEATFLDEDRPRARETRHSTALEAAELAAAAGVSLLALTHLASRVPPRAAAVEAQTRFAATAVPHDFDQIEVPFPERGGPRLAPARVVRGNRIAAGAAPTEEGGTLEIDHL